MKPAEREKLLAALKAAKEAALAADPGAGNDGGACNKDVPAILLPRVQEKTLKAIAAEAGVTFGWRRGGYVTVYVPLHGQGDRRTAMAEAAEKALSAAGYKTTVFYGMD